MTWKNELFEKTSKVGKRKRLAKFTMAVTALFSSLLLSAAPAMATSISGVRIKSMLYVGGRILVELSTDHPPGCGCCNDRYEIAVNDANSQALMSIIMTAYAQAKLVDITGTGSCSGGGTDTEWMSSIRSY